MKNYLSIDQGTTSSRAIVFDPNLSPLRESQKEYDLSYPRDGWVEGNPSDIIETVKKTVEDVLKNHDDIKACGITNQRETTVIWSKKTGKPIYPAIIWQDRRTSDLCNKLKSDGYEKMVSEKTGLLLDPYFSGTKIMWILENVDGARNMAEKGELLFGTIDTYLIYKLSKEKNHFTDVTNASRTLLFNIKTMEWDKDLLDLFNIPISMMPDVLACDENFGTLSVGSNEIPIRGVIGDQQSALVGQNCFNKGDMKSTYGTGCFLMVNTEDNPVSIKEGLLTTIAYKLNGKIHYAIEGSIYSCGNIIKWLRDEMKFFKNADESEFFLDKTGDSNNILFLPAFNGLGAPYWNSDIRGGFYGITQDTSIKDMTTACFLAITFQTKEITSILEKYNIEINNLLIDGGMANNGKFCQVLADTLQKKILRPNNVESTALGACKVAMIGSGENIDEIPESILTTFANNQKLLERYEEGFSIWRKYLSNSL